MLKSITKERSGKTTLFKRITKSVVLLVVSLFLVTGIILGSVVYTTSKSSMLKQLDDTSTAYALAVEKDLGILQEQINSLSQYAVNMGGLLSSQKINDSLDAMKKERGFTTIYGIDKTGLTSIAGLYVNDREYFQSAIQGGFYASSPFLKTDNTIGITAAGPAYRNGEIDGIISVGLTSGYFSQFIDFTIGKTGTSVIIDKNGTIVADLDIKKVESFYNPIELAKSEKKYQSQADVYTKFLSGDLESIEFTSPENQKKIAIAKPISNTDNWLLVTTMDIKEFYQTPMLILSLLIVIVLVGLIVGVISAMILARSISAPIKEISSRLTMLSDGDLSSEVMLAESKDEIQTLSEALRNTVSHLRDYIKEIEMVTVSMAQHNLSTIITSDFQGEFQPIKESINKIVYVMNHSFCDIADSSNQVNSGAHQVSAAAQALSQSTTEQAASVEQIAAALGTVSAQVKDNASDADSAKEKVNNIGNQIEESNQKMLDLATAMNDISRSSDAIGKIIKTIDDIAFQTNILALNAAVEAARAGEAGKGFAVVADEVRNLASKSAEASKSTTDLILGSVKAVESGTQIADGMAEHLNNVVSNVKGVVETIERISAATSIQANSIQEITLSIDQISGVVQANSATAEESAATSEVLSNQSLSLKQLTDQFILTKENDDK